MAPKLKHNWLLSRHEAAELLRKLADTLEEGPDELGQYGISLAELVNFKIKIDLGEQDALEVKFTGKGLKTRAEKGPDGSGETGGNYSSCKKRMQENFNSMRQSVGRGEMPSQEVVSAFLADSEKMMSQSGYGDEAYPAFAELCTRLRTAVDAENLSGTAAVIMELSQAKKSCHARYKEAFSGGRSSS